MHRADTYAGKHVNSIYMQEMLRELLNARTGPPKLQPVLVNVKDRQRLPGNFKLSQSQKLALMGEYQGHNESVIIDLHQGRLQITNPYTGSFYLYPKSATEFEIEDEQYPAKFALDETGKAKNIKIWFRPDEYVEMSRK
ncbi:MAG: hypothetical protein AAF353_03205 [Pseudomonadota bacterium]